MIIYGMLTAVMKLLGKRQIGQMQQSEFVTALFLSELACFVVTDPSIPVLYGVLPVLVMLAVEVLVSFGSIRFPRLKRALDEAPSFLMRDGKIDQAEMRKNRVTIDELLSMLRLAGAHDPSEVRDAILEPNGQLSVIPSDKNNTVFAVVEDGRINEKALRMLHKDSAWLLSQLKKPKNAPENLFLVLADKEGIRYIARKGSPS